MLRVKQKFVKNRKNGKPQILYTVVHYLSFLDEVGHHDDTPTFELPDDAPHIVNAPFDTACSIAPTSK